MKLALYNYFRSSASWRVRIALYWKGLPFEYIAVPLVEGAQRRDEYAALNPMRQVPTLVVDDVELAQSVAILEWLEEAHPAPPLLPREPLLRARVRQLVEIVNSGIQPHQNLPVLAGVKQLGGDAQAWARGFISDGLMALEALAGRHAGQFLVGDAVSFADLCLVPQLAAARRFAVDLSAMPTLLRVESTCASLEAFQRAHADAQPDTPKS